MNNGSWLSSIIYFIFIFVIFYLVLIRPQQKRQKKHRELLGGLQVNDEIITIGGIFGTVTKINDKTVTIKIADKVEVELLKSSVSTKKTPEQE